MGKKTEMPVRRADWDSDLSSVRRRAISARSVSLGALGVLLLSAFAPFNDLILNGSAMIGGALPIGATFFFVCLVLLINAPLCRFRPRMALRSGELTVILIMLLVGSAIPTRGLMSMWPASLVGVWHHAAERPDYRLALRHLALPQWFWPSGAAEPGPTESVIAWFYSRIPPDEPARTQIGLLDHWLAPLVGWAAFFTGLATAVIGLSIILARQWIYNERLPFPIATIQLALVESPPPGRWLNRTFASAAFLIGAGLVLGIRLLDGLHLYFRTHVPAVALSYSLRDIFVDPPWSYVDSWLTAQTIYPLVIAMTYFVSSKIALSLWAFVLISQVPGMIMQSSGSSMNPHRGEISLGAMLIFAMMIGYSGRHFYGHVARLMVTRTPAEQTETRFFLLFRTAGWMIAGGAILAAGWLITAGMPIFPAILLIVAFLLIWTVMAAVVAHSGLLICNSVATPHEWFSRAFTNPGGLSSLNLGHLRTQFFAQFVGGMWAYNSDHLTVYATHSLKIADERAPRTGWRLIAVVALALLLAFGASFLSTLYCQYTYATTADASHELVNGEIINGQPRWAMDHVVRTMRGELAAGRRNQSSWPWVTGSALLTGILAAGQLRYAAWPLHPIGLLMVYSFPIRRIWFSLFLGWVIKAIVVRYGGAGLYKKATPFFIGAVLGEVVAAGAFALLAFVLWYFGIDYQVANFLPTSQY